MMMKNLKEVMDLLANGDKYRTADIKEAQSIENELIQEELVYSKVSNYYDGIRNFEFNL